MTYKRVRRARAATAVVDAYVGPIGELVIDTDLLEIRLQNGVAGGLRVPRFGGPAVFTTASFADGTAALPSITNTGDLNTGLYFPAADTVAISTAGIERLQVDPAGNAGLGVPPSAWRSLDRAFQVRQTIIHDINNTSSAFGQNYYLDSGNLYRYQKNGFASMFVQNGGDVGRFEWHTAPSGTAGNPITFTQAMTLTQGGNLLVGTTTDDGYRAQVITPSAVGATRLALELSDRNSVSLNFSLQENVANIIAGSADTLVLGANNAEAARITSARYFKASNTGSYITANGVDNSNTAYHVFNNTANDACVFASANNTGSTTYSYYSVLPAGATGFHATYQTGATQVYQVLANGNVQNTNNSYGAISMRSLKNLISQKSGADYWEKYKQIKFWIYSLISDPTNQQLLGVVAEELEELFPGLIERTKNVIKVQKTREVQQTRQVTVTEQQEQSTTEIKLVDGKYVQVTTKTLIDVQVPQFDEYPVFDEAGNPVMQLVSAEIEAVPAQEEVTDEEGNVITPATPAIEGKPAVYAPLMHKVARMETITVTESYEESEEDGTETLAVKYSVLGLIADTITQELQHRVEDLTARLIALEAA